MRYPALLALLAAAIPVSAFAQTAPPKTDAKPVEDTYHGVKVSDPYRWLEDWSSPDVKAWSEAQNAYARSVLDHLPSVEPIRARVTEVLGAASISYASLSFHAGKVFAIKKQPPMQQPFLVVMDSVEHPDSARVLVNPNTFNAVTAIDWYVPSPDGTLVAVSMSQGGSESGDLRIVDVATGEYRQDEIIPHVQNGTAGGSLAWTPDGKGFYYTRYPRGDERPTADRDFYMQVYKHTLGTKTETDTYEIGKDFPKIAEIVLDTNKAGVVLASVQKGDGGEFQHYIRTLDGTWTQIDAYEDRVVQAEFGFDDSADKSGASTVLLISRKFAPKGKLLKFKVDNHDAAKMDKIGGAAVLIPEGIDTMISTFADETGNIAATPEAVYVTYQMGGPSQVRAFDWSGKRLSTSPTQFDIGAFGPMVTTDQGVIFGNTSYVNPPSWFSYSGGKTVKLPLSQTSPLDFSEYEVVREFATSKDGHTQIPINITRKKGLKLDGSHPCMVTAYGGYGVNIAPSFRAGNRVLLEQGVVIAEANIRGGGEFGEEWHSQGNLLNKQNVFDDFYAACRHMVDAKYTTHDKMVIQGGSNGGLLMGATLTQHPDVAKCVVSHVGIYDMLRVELSANGAFNIPEFGSVKDEAQFKALYAYSPYQNVHDGTKYPAVLFLTGANDPRVDPMQSRKMTARLQAAGASVLLRTSANSGHGIGSSLGERIEQAVDVDAFIFHQLGVTFDPHAAAMTALPAGSRQAPQGHR